MYYVAKLNKVFNPTIVETFEDSVLAFNYANIMNSANKGNYIVLEEALDSLHQWNLVTLHQPNESE